MSFGDQPSTVDDVNCKEDGIITKNESNTPRQRFTKSVPKKIIRNHFEQVDIKHKYCNLNLTQKELIITAFGAHHLLELAPVQVFGVLTVIFMYLSSVSRPISEKQTGLESR